MSDTAVEEKREPDYFPLGFSMAHRGFVQWALPAHLPR